MAIIQTITDDYHFWNWLQNSDNYSKNFSIKGANVLQAYYDNLSDEIGENIEFDPIAWCYEFSEYDSFDNFQYDTGYTDENGIEHLGYENITTLDELKDNTTVIELDNGGILVSEF